MIKNLFVVQAVKTQFQYDSDEKIRNCENKRTQEECKSKNFVCQVKIQTMARVTGRNRRKNDKDRKKRNGEHSFCIATNNYGNFVAIPHMHTYIICTLKQHLVDQK